MKPINRRSFIKFFTGGLLGAGLVPMLGVRESIYMPPPDVKFYVPTDSTYGTAISDQITIEPMMGKKLRAEFKRMEKQMSDEDWANENVEFMKVLQKANQAWLRDNSWI